MTSLLSSYTMASLGLHGLTAHTHPEMLHLQRDHPTSRADHINVNFTIDEIWLAVNDDCLALGLAIPT